MGMSDTEPPAIDAGLIPTQFVSGILPPRFDGEVWTIEAYEERAGERFIVARFILSQGGFMRTVASAVAPVASAFGLPPSLQRLDA